MAELPKTLEEAVAQSMQATLAALDDGYRLLQVELAFPEIALQAQAIAQQFIPAVQEYQLKVFFPDTGAAALARRDWGEVPFKVDDIGSSRSPLAGKITPEDELFLVVNPSAVEVAQVEKLYNLAGDRPVVILNPNLEDVAIVGIGLAGRQLRERFLNKIFSCYYLRPLSAAALIRCYPEPWQVWQETTESEYKLIAETAGKPLGEALEQILAPATQTDEPDRQQPSQQRRKGFLGQLQSFLRALSQ
ncbi:MAG: DUF1995 family protein [Hormoscilla sp. GM102CHS1]|nr:DUF1995 family protein [Hormoscilla sp. SP12CHS1]MBC6472527.1 DUF1995 family protein [Hormoscilla sp. GM102CHS1]